MTNVSVMLFDKVKRLWFKLRHHVIGEVWQLHHVTNFPAPDESMKPYYITPDRLERLVLEYRCKGYDFISLDDLFKPRKHKFIAVTLDDGYEDNYLEAWPLFKKLSVPFCIFVASDYVFDEALRLKEKGMTPLQLKNIAADLLCTIGGHTKSHCHLNRISAKEQESEIVESISVLETFLKSSIRHFAYPFGDYDDETCLIIKRFGLSGYAAWGGMVRKRGNYNSEAIPRVIVTSMFGSI